MTPEDPEAPVTPSSRRTALLYAGPLVALLLLFIVLPLARGTETLILRDVLNSHFPMKWSQALALRSGYFPLIDPYRAGGQPLAGNLNAVPFYPDNVLYLFGSPFWALNAHFWIHLLLAPFAFFWMARAWGLRREAAWAGAVCYTASGYFLSHLNFYNLIAGAALGPALVAACLGFASPRHRGLHAAAVAVLWTLLVLGGDPLLGLLSFGLALGALAAVWRERSGEPWRAAWRPLTLLAAAFACGTLLALPQIVEFLRILPLSYRGHFGYNATNATISSWDPRQAAEWLLPFLFGRLDVLGRGAFWGGEFFTGVPPYYVSLYPGLLALALLVAAGRPRSRAAWWAWGGIFLGIFLALGRFNPAAEWLLTASGNSSLRYPIKFWPLVAVGAAFLCGLGFERLLAGDPAVRRRFRRFLGALALAYAAFWLFLNLLPGPAEAWLNLFIPPRPAAFVTNERLRWAGLCLFSLLILAALGIALRLTRRSWAVGGALLLAVHALSQLFLMRPLYPTDAVKPYLVPPPALAHLPQDVAVVNPDYNYLFGPSSLRQGRFPSPDYRWVERRSFYELFPFTAPLWRRRYELNVSPEGLDTFLTRMAQNVVKGSANHEDRLRLLAAWGIGRLVVDHPLDPLPSRARLLAAIPSSGRELFVFEVTGRAPEVFLARRVFRAEHLQATYKRMLDPGFDPATDAVLFGTGNPRTTGGGTARLLRRKPEEIEVATEAGPGGALLVLQRANLLFKATVDDHPAEVVTANAHRIGVEVPAGRHTVRFFLDRRPLHRSLAGTAAGLLLLPVLVWWGRRSAPARLVRPVDPALDRLEDQPQDAESGDG